VILSAVSGSGRDSQQSLECIVDQIEVDLAQFALFHGGTPNKAASVTTVPPLSLAKQLGSFATLAAIRRTSSRLANVVPVTGPCSPINP
jgi:hypothetical protein